MFPIVLEMQATNRKMVHRISTKGNIYCQSGWYKVSVRFSSYQDIMHIRHFLVENGTCVKIIPN